MGILATAGLIWAGIGFAGYAIFAGLAPDWGPAGAAGATAGGMLFLAALATGVLLSGKTPAPTPNKVSHSLLGAIARLAQERPLIAMLGAALLGAAEVLLDHHQKRK